VGGATRFFWSTEGDPPRVINDLSEITDAHIRAIEPPRNEKDWLDPTGWMGVYTTRLIATAVQVVGLPEGEPARYRRYGRRARYKTASGAVSWQGGYIVQGGNADEVGEWRSQGGLRRKIAQQCPGI